LKDIFTGRLLSEIPDALSHLLTSILNLPKLTKIDLSDNAFGINTHAPLVAFLAEHVPLQHLILNNNGLGPHCGILVADSLSALHTKKEEAREKGQDIPELETVVCGRNRLENGSMTAWARTYSLHNKVKLVKMVQNGIRPEGIAHLLGQGLSNATELEVLDLEDNTFTLNGAKSLAKTTPRWTKLRELSVGDCVLSAKGGVLLAGALAEGKNPALQTLRLQFNDITSKGVQALLIALKGSLPALKRMELNGNKFDEGNPAILEIIDKLEARKEMSDEAVIIEDDWGVDELDELDEESEEEEDEESEPEVEELAEKLVKEAEEAQEEPTVQLDDKVVNQLAKDLEKTHV
jgi:Ran GTPase-activating protein 1